MLFIIMSSAVATVTMIPTLVSVTDYHVLYFCNFSYIMLSAVTESHAIVTVTVYHVICCFNCHVICCSVTNCHVLCCCNCYLLSCNAIVVSVTEYHVICCCICYQVACFRLLQILLTIMFSAAVTVTYYNLTVTNHFDCFCNCYWILYTLCFCCGCCLLFWWFVFNHCVWFSLDLFLHYLQYYRDSFQKIFLNLKPIVFTRS